MGKVWVTWKDGHGGERVDKVVLGPGDDFSDLRKQFVKEQQLGISPGLIDVYAGTDKLEEDASVAPFFVSDSPEAKPGQSKATALRLEWAAPSAPTQGDKHLIIFQFFPLFDPPF